MLSLDLIAIAPLLGRVAAATGQAGLPRAFGGILRLQRQGWLDQANTL